MTHDPTDDDARALFAAGAEERAPARLRAALLARARSERRAEVAERAPLPSRPLLRSTLRSRRIWAAASLAAAAGIALFAGSRARQATPEAGPLISAEHVPGSAARPVEPTLPATPAQVPAPLVPAPARSRPPARETKGAPAPREKRPALAPSPDPLPQAQAGPLPTPAASPEAPAADLGAQLKRLQSVQKALRAGEHQRALELLAARDVALESGDFIAEARLMRIEALAGAGQAAEARRLAREFLQQFPHSPLVDRARRFSQPEPTP